MSYYDKDAEKNAAQAYGHGNYDGEKDHSDPGVPYNDPTHEHVGLAPAHDSDKLHRALSARQVSMIAIGGTIGTGLFLGTGKSLSTGGPASMVIAYAIVGAIVYITMLSLGEMSTFIPVAGSFCTFVG